MKASSSPAPRCSRRNAPCPSFRSRRFRSRPRPCSRRLLELSGGTLGSCQRGSRVAGARTFQRVAVHVPGEALGLQAKRLEERLLSGGRPEKFALLRTPGAEDLDLAHVAERKAPAQGDQRRGSDG